MGDPVVVAEGDGRQNLLHYRFGVRFGKCVHCAQLLEQVASFTQIGDYIELDVVLVVLVEGSDARMLHLAQNVHLTLDPSQFLGVRNLLENDLHSPLYARILYICGFPDLREAPSAEQLP